MDTVKKEIILITGCSGLIGFRCAEKLQMDFQILGIDVLLIGHLPGVELIGIDLASSHNVEEGLTLIKERFGNKIHSVIHLAAYYTFNEGHWAEYERITINGTKVLLTTLKEKFEVGQFIFSSTMLVHAPCEINQKINEESPIAPKWNYPKSKVITEKLIKELHGNIPYVILRIAGIYDDLCHSIPLSNQIQRIYENRFESHVFPGNIHHGASFMHIDDLVDAICAIVKKRDTLPKELTLLLGEPVTLSYDELQRQIAKLIWNKQWKTWSIPKPIAKFGAFLREKLPFLKPGFIKSFMIDLADDHYVLDISKAQTLLNWQPKHQLKDVLPEWIAMLKKEPIAWYDMNKLKIPHKVRE